MKRIAIGVGIVVIAVGVFFALRPRPVELQMAQATKQTVREYISEEAKTRLPDTYTVDMPINGTLQRVALEVGDPVARGEVIARIDPFDLKQQILGLEAQIMQARAQIIGVDASKPKAEDLKGAEVQIQQQRDALEIAQKELDIARIKYKDAEKDHTRYQRLHESGAVSQSQFDSIEVAYDAAKRNLERAEAAEAAARKAVEQAGLQHKRLVDSVDDNEYLRQVYEGSIVQLQSQMDAAKNDLAKTDIAAPVDGVVLEKYIEDRRVLAAGTPVLLLGPKEKIEIESDILSEEVGQIEVGDPVEIYGKALNDNTIIGHVTRIYPSGFKKISALGIEQQRVKILVGFDNSTYHLRPQTRVDVRVITDETQDALAIPERALFRKEGGWAVMAVRGGRAHETPVSVGLKNNEWAQITDGLSAGDTVITELKNDLEDGTRVKEAKS